MSTPTPTRIPQRTRLLHASPSLSTKTSILSPKSWSSPQRTSTPKYQLQDPGVTPGSPKVIKRMTIRPPGSGVIKPMRSGNGTSKVESIMDTEQVVAITPTKGTIPSASLWAKPPSFPQTASVPSSSRKSYRESIPPSFSASATSTRIPVPRSRSIPNTRLTPTMSRSRLPPSPAISISATVATAPSTPTQRSSIPVPSSRSRIPLPISPAISISATVATASPSPRVESHKEAREVGSEVDCGSVYSSASAMAFDRYRAPSPSLNDVSASTEYDHKLSRMSSTSSFSSASSLARHRISQRCSVPSDITSILPAPAIGQSVPMSTKTTTTEDMALVWQPDPESTGSDPAANLWMEIEARLNRGRVRAGVGMTDERGQWILTRQRHRPNQDQQVAHRKEVEEDEEDDHGDGQRNDDGGEEEQQDDDDNWIRSEEMRKELSQFTVSAYFDPDLSTPIAPSSSYHSSRHWRSCSIVRSHSRAGTGSDMEGTAIFDMAAPLVTSISSVGSEGGVSATPANTPLIHYETIQRVSRVRKSYSGSSFGSRSGSMRMSSMVSRLDPIGKIGRESRGRSDSSSAEVGLGHRNVPESIPMIDAITGLHEHNVMGSGMIRLDSHVQAALEVLSDNPDSPSSIVLDTDIQTQSTYLGTYHDGANEPSPYTEIDESTPMPIPLPYDTTPTYHHTEHQTRPYTSDDSHSSPNTLDMEEVGLGIGMALHLDSIYSLPVSSRLVRRETNHSTSTSEASEGSTGSSSVGPVSSETSVRSREGSQDSYEYRHYPDPVRRPVVEICESAEVVDDEEEEEMLTVTDLDTGHRVDLSIKRLDELWIL